MVSWNVLQLCVPCCAVLPGGLGWLKFSENQGLQIQGCFSLSTEHLICLLFLAKWSIAETPYNVTCGILFFNPPP